MWCLLSILAERCTLLSISNDVACSFKQFGITNVENDEVMDDAKMVYLNRTCILIGILEYLPLAISTIVHLHLLLILDRRRHCTRSGSLYGQENSYLRCYFSTDLKTCSGTTTTTTTAIIFD